jgi:hypothetical protein
MTNSMVMYIIFGLVIPQATGLIVFIAVRRISSRLMLISAIIPAGIYAPAALLLQHMEAKLWGSDTVI